MKVIVVALSLLSSFASAEMKSAGGFIPKRCGSYSQGSVCFGVKARTEGEFLEISGNNGTSYIYEIASRTPINGGINPQARAETLDLRSAKYGKAVAVVRSVLGNGTSVTVHFADGGQITATDFQVVATTL
jgi:hypothetical protein